MPFVGMKRQKELEAGAIPKKVGDICNLAYVPMVKQFLNDPSWTTIHNIKKHTIDINLNLRRRLENEWSQTLFSIDDINISADLAWQEFWDNYGHPYEIKKRKANGDVV